MKSLKLKTTCQMAANEVGYSLANPAAKLGECGMIRTVEITDIPAGTEDHAVVKAWRETADSSWSGTPDLKYPRHSYRFAEIGGGKIIRA